MTNPANAEQAHRAGQTTLTDAELDQVGGGAFGVFIAPGSIIRPIIQTISAQERGTYAANVAQTTDRCTLVDPCHDF